MLPPSLREAVQKLVAKGLLISRQGGGNYVSDSLGSSFSDPLLALLEGRPEAQRDLLESLGFALEPFGGNTWAVRTAPAILGHRDLGEMVRALIASLEQGAGPEALDDVRRELAAWYLLETSLPVERIAEKLGYQDPSNFSRTFQRWFGTTPGSFRRE